MSLDMDGPALGPIVILIPVLNRPERVDPTLWSLENGRGQIPYRPLFLVSKGDRRELAAVRSADADYLETSWPAGQGDYARKMNLGLRETAEPWLFLGADDLCYCPGWTDEAFTAHQSKLRPPGSHDAWPRVIGTNDLGNSRVTSGSHATHSLVHRSYADLGTIDEPGLLLHEGYHHNFVDDEFVRTAMSRGEFLFAASAWVEHLHPHWGKGKLDSTYQKGLRNFEEDRGLLARRRPLWEKPRRRLLDTLSG